MMRSILQGKLRLNFSLSSKNNHPFSFKALSKQTFSKSKGHSQSLCLSLAFGLFSLFYHLKSKVKCIQRQNFVEASSLNDGEVEIYQLNKSQFLQLLTSINEEGILIIFNKYFKNEHEKEFAQKLQELYNQSKKLNIKKIYLIEQNEVKHLETFEKWLRKQKAESKQTLDSGNKENKAQYFLLTPDFRNNPFRLDEQEISQEINEIRKCKIQLNPTNIKEEIFANYQTKFNLTTVVKQCPDFVPPTRQNECLEDYRTKIATLIEQKMLKNKSDEYRFYAVTPNSKKDFEPLVSFHNSLKQYQHEEKSSYLQSVVEEFYEPKKIENTYVLRNDMLGREIQNMKSFKKRNYSMFKSLSSLDKFLLFIRPRIFIVSKSNSSIDLYWYVTCLHKNRQPTISINNTDSFNLGRKYPVTDGLSYPLNSDLEFLKIMYTRHPQLNYLVVNTEIVSELIRHLPVKRRYTIFNLTSDLIYPKMFLPNYDQIFSPEDNYKTNFKPLIEKYLANPKNYDSVVLDKEKKINQKDLEEMLKNKNDKFVLRVCSLNCQQDLQQKQLQLFFRKLNSIEQQNSEKTFQGITDSKNPEEAVQIQVKKWQNQVYKRIYWIDSHFNNIGLKDGTYIFQEGKFSQI